MLQSAIGSEASALSQGERVVAAGDRVRGLCLTTLPKNLTQKVNFQTSSLIGSRPSFVSEKVEVPLAAHACGANEVLDDEDGDFTIHGDHEGTPQARLGVMRGSPC